MVRRAGGLVEDGGWKRRESSIVEFLEQGR